MHKGRKLALPSRQGDPQTPTIRGPGLDLAAGRFVFEPHLDSEPGSDGLLLLEVALDGQPAVRVPARGDLALPLRFEVREPGARFDFHVRGIEGVPQPAFSLFGGRLLQEDARGRLRDAEVLSLLLELVSLRLGRTGVLSGLEA